MDAKEKARIVYDRLLEHWGLPDWNTLPAIDELVNTILSQNTNDRGFSGLGRGAGCAGGRCDRMYPYRRPG